MNQAKPFGDEPRLTCMNASLPTTLLSGAGIVLASLGLFAAGDIAVVALGLGTVFAGGILHVMETWIRLRTPGSSMQVGAGDRPRA